MSPEQRTRILERMDRDFDKMDISEYGRNILKDTYRELLDKLVETSSWSPATKAYLDGMDKLDELIRAKKDGKVCLLHDCESCPKE